jgi:hypothetical protein
MKLTAKALILVTPSGNGAIVMLVSEAVYIPTVTIFQSAIDTSYKGCPFDLSV